MVVDASVLVHALGDDEASGDLARRRLRGESLVAPELIDLEVASAWRRHAAHGRMPERRAARALADLKAMPLLRISHRILALRCWELRDNLTPYDAAYVAVAELFEALLLTADVALSRAPGIRCDVEMLQNP
jgi:predicted nucleic acid-binding protein